MKKIFAFLTALSIIASSAIALADEINDAADHDITITEVADTEVSDTETDPDAVTVFVNGTELVADVPAQIINDRTMVPMRAIFERLGADVSWLQEEQAIFATRGATLIVMKIGVKTLAISTINGENKNVELDVPPQIVNDRTLVPVRAVSEALGCTVGWDGETRTVTITQ